jgi:thiol:disulfide interchange protein DsbC
MTSPTTKSSPTKLILAIATAVALGSALLHAAQTGRLAPTQSTKDVEAVIRAGLQKHTKGEVHAEVLRPTPIPSLWEAVTKTGELFYVDATGQFSFVDGRLVDMEARKDLTSVRLNELKSIDFKSLPFELAIKVGSGSRVLAVFEDPTCSVCRPHYKFLTQIPDTTIYHFPYPVVTKQSLPIAGTVWCAPDKQKAWDEAMTSQGMQLVGKPACDISGIKAILDLGEKLNVQGTPTVFLANGRRLQGATPPDQFMAALEESAKQMGGQFR